MARVVAVFDDLLLGSNVLGMLRAAGHEARLAGPEDLEVAGADVVIVDLGSDGFDGVALRERLGGRGGRIGVYSHVRADVKARAEAAGFDLVVPRSRMAREGPALVERAAGAASGGEPRGYGAGGGPAAVKSNARSTSGGSLRIPNSTSQRAHARRTSRRS